jgi:hypothetical protein
MFRRFAFVLRFAPPIRQALQLFQGTLEPSLFDPSCSTSVADKADGTYLDAPTTGGGMPRFAPCR